MISKPTIGLSRVDWHGNVHIGLSIEYDRALIEELKKLYPEIRWCPQRRLWHLPYRHQFVGELFQHFKGRYWIDYKVYYEQMDIQKAKTARPSESLPELDEFREKLIEQYRKYLFSKRYAESTIKTYSEALRIFFRYFHDKPIDEIDNADLIQFNNEYILKNAYSQAYQNQVVNAVKLFYRKIQHRKLDPDVIERPRTEKKLPNVLSKEEVKMILDALDNVKHKTMLILIYACGLRRSELLNLKLLDIHSTRNQLVVRMSKGKKDRIIPISNVLITLLRSYYAQYKPEIYLFEGQKVGEPYSARSLELVIKKSLTKTTIKKPVTLHWLRHSYATHLHESGTDIRFIQELLGHKSTRTTEIYTHVSNRSLQMIRSPFDDLNL